MNTYEKCKAIRKSILDVSAEIIAYHESWGSDFSMKELVGIPDRIRKMKSGNALFDIQPADMTDNELSDLGFGRWSKENPMRLIPLWLFPFLADEIEVECIDGEKGMLKKSEMDNDNRFGCLAYGVIPKNPTND